jgi:NAD(P)-dependent dehydrogenase (short-subunit alcohol dehydrogenase family)
VADKVALVTGASAGIGRATATSLAGAGWTVVGVSRRGTAGPGWTGAVMDVDDDTSVVAGVKQVLDVHGQIDALVTCAGWGLGGAVEQVPLADAKAQVETNLWGSVRAVQAVLPGMRARRSGRIVLMSSIGGIVGVPFQAFYTASKFAIEGLGEALAYEVEPFGVKVTLVEPGNICTEFTDKRRVVVGPAAAPGEEPDPYAQALAKAVGVMERDERNGAAPGQVASVVRKVLDARRPPRRVSVGRISARAGVVGKRVLPFRAFQAAARSSLGV